MFANSSLFTLFSLLLVCLTSSTAQARMVNDEVALVARHFGGVGSVVQGAVSKRQDLSAPVCVDKATQLNSHDCNVALLSTGTGISGKIEFLRVNALSTTGKSGDCAVTVTAINGGTAIDVSKGRFEAGFKSFKASCGVTPGHVDIKGGSVGGGDLRITVSQINAPA